MWTLLLAILFGVAWLLTLAAWFVVHGREQMKRDALAAKLDRVLQQLAGAERKKDSLINEIDAYRTTIDRLRGDRARPPLVPPTGASPHVPPRIALVSRRDDGPAFEDTQIL